MTVLLFCLTTVVDPMKLSKFAGACGGMVKDNEFSVMDYRSCGDVVIHDRKLFNINWVTTFSINFFIISKVAMALTIVLPTY